MEATKLVASEEAAIGGIPLWFHVDLQGGIASNADLAPFWEISNCVATLPNCWAGYVGFTRCFPVDNGCRALPHRQPRAEDQC